MTYLIFFLDKINKFHIIQELYSKIGTFLKRYPTIFYAVFNLTLFLISSPLLIASHNNPKEFKELTSDEILNNSNKLKQAVDKVYEKIGENLQNDSYFIRPPKDEEYSSEDEANRKLGKNFDIYGINLCTAGVQFLVKDQHNKVFITDFDILKNEKNRIPIFSCSQTIQWNNYIIQIENIDHQILSWPYTSQKHPYDFDYINGLGQQLDEMATPDALSCISKKDIENEGDYLHLFPNTYKIFKDFFDKEDKNEIFNNQNDFTNNIKIILEQDLISTKQKYSDALGITVKDYKSLFFDAKDPINFVEEKDLLTHSEPLFCWWMNNNIENLYNEANFKILMPLVYIYTFRETCIDCEKIVQTSASGKYVPIISFSDEYLNEGYEIYNGNFIKTQKSFAPLPFLKKNEKFSLSLETLNKILKFKKPSTDERRYPIQIKLTDN